MNNNTKLAKIRDAMAEENWDTALRIANSFSNLGDQKESIKLAAESVYNPSFFLQMGYDLNKLKEDGIKALKERYSHSWEEVSNKKK